MMQLGRNFARLLHSWDTPSFENAIAFINSGGNLRQILLREHGLYEGKAVLRSETNLGPDIRIIESRLADLRPYAVTDACQYAETYDGSTRLLRGIDALYAECVF